MLARRLSRAIRHSTGNALHDACRLCTCTCGRTFFAQPAIGDRRGRRSSTYSRTYRQRLKKLPGGEAIAAADEQAKAQKEKYENLVRDGPSQYIQSWLESRSALGLLDASLGGAIKFANAFTRLAVPERPDPQSKSEGLAVDTVAFERLREETGMSALDCEYLASALADVRLDVPAKRLMYTLSAVGVGAATLHIVEQYLVEARYRPNVLSRSELAPVRQHLRDMADGKMPGPGGRRFVAQVCEGRVLVTTGDYRNAIRRWEAAMPDAVAYANEDLELRSTEMNSALRANLAPWIEMANVCMARGDAVKAREAVAIGCQVDDPISHYAAAVLERNTDEGQHVATSDWLYHITKAAASIYPKATHALGLWYATSQWKYIEDEPPDHIKPTPFDSYPGESDTDRSSVLQRLLTVFGLRAPATSIPTPEKEKEGLFLTAAFPSDPYGRWKMGMQWLDISMKTSYAPSYLLAAALYLEKTLWMPATAPKAALELGDDRYTYASKADYQTGRKIDRPTEPSDEYDGQEVPNPGYNPEKAKELIREVFYAAGSLAVEKHIVKGPGVQKANYSADAMLHDDNLRDIQENHRKWFRLAEVRDMYVDTKKWICVDDAIEDKPVDIALKAQQICDEQGWDIYDSEDRLLYKCGIGGKVKMPRIQWARPKRPGW
ncbi:hypothetical protein BDY17DRAFT_325285 [Neohortaea acidophila]|uniref:Uncharacterized protein n=1 Tax=Neohortaea acidophila TaxID=245834 RepID=A0A6A6PQ20_9PEZI|nr:uncharacterized protein BDY17DRAFT_325285 [Neohortaea acidophila]KAF2481771.1 hypothetical protein BDY17DRAFT_325285 [Neohortaea acidophila]